jgi:hypothetical protein
VWLRLALIGTNGGIAATVATAMRITLEVLIELALIVIEKKQGALMVGLFNHPGEVAFFPGTVKLALYDCDHRKR